MKCYRCGKSDHKSYRCHNTQDKRPANVSVCQTVVKSNLTPQASPTEPTRNPDTCAHAEVLSCEHWVEVVSTAVGMPVVRCSVCGKEADILRGNGCSTLVVRSDLIPTENFIGKKRLVKLADGKVERNPLAHVYINSPFYTESILAVYRSKPPHDVLIGNVPGALKLEDISKESEEIANAMVTRGLLLEPNNRNSARG